MYKNNLRNGLYIVSDNYNPDIKFSEVVLKS